MRMEPIGFGRLGTSAPRLATAGAQQRSAGRELARYVAAGALAKDGLLVTRGHAIETLAAATTSSPRTHLGV